MRKELYIAVHHHHYGISVYPVLSDHLPSEEEIIKVWNIDFEPDKDEYIDIEPSGRVKEI